MRKIVLAGAVLAGLTPAAYAADMPAPAPIETVAPEPLFSWTGFYIGAHGGWNWAETDPDAALGFLGDMDNFVVGGQIGYNWQWDSWVLGLEGDGSFVNNDDDFVDGGGFPFGVEQDFLASFRGRVGFAVDRFLLFGTGGAAFTGLSFDAVGFDDDADYFGWVAGGGIEYAITDNVTIGVEYLHYEFDDEEIGDGVLPPDTNIGLSNDVVRGRLNVKFDSLFN
ncbi:outer membrane protein [Flaviflagellibacter deserti]|uniref:Outer membrane protein n=1 Tax=Flaviflagellibacter deserti TaxID=2267266 RepID=A0ABV9YYD0_9HYPH